MLLTWAPQVLRDAGLTVVETGGWTSRSHGSFPDAISGIWHHDASPPGDSPGVLDWMISNWNSASANFWVNRQGVWYCVGAGVAWHAGTVESGMPNNYSAFGVETDQTINETPSPPMLDSVQRGMAALLKHMGRDANSLYFHKTVAPSRKVDPWLGPSSANSSNWGNELNEQRGIVQNIMNGGSTPTPIPQPDEGFLGMSDAQINQMLEHLGEIRRMVGVLTGYPGGADVENSVGVQVAGAINSTHLAENTSEIRRMTGVAIGYPPASETEHNLAQQ